MYTPRIRLHDEVKTCKHFLITGPLWGISFTDSDQSYNQSTWFQSTLKYIPEDMNSARWCWTNGWAIDICHFLLEDTGRFVWRDGWAGNNGDTEHCIDIQGVSTLKTTYHDIPLAKQLATICSRGWGHRGRKWARWKCGFSAKSKSWRMGMGRYKFARYRTLCRFSHQTSNVRSWWTRSIQSWKLAQLSGHRQPGDISHNDRSL